MTRAPSQDVVKNSGQVAVWTLVSRATGFGRVLAISMVLGATFTGNLFQLANQLPWVLYELAAGSLIASLLVPVLVDALRQSKEQAREIVGRFASAITAIFAIVTVVFLASSPLLVALLSRNVPEASIDRYQNLGVVLIAVTGPQLMMYGLIAVAVAAQNSTGHFAFAAAAPAIENVIVIAAVLIYAVTAEAGAEIGTVATGPLLLLAAASTGGAFVHMMCQFVAAKRAGLGIRLTKNIASPELRAMMGRAKATGATAAFAGLRHFVLLIVSGTVAGGIVAYQLAVSFLNLPIALGARPVATAQLPVLSDLAIRDDREGFVKSYRSGIALASIVVIPAAIAMAAFAPSLARGLALGELSDEYGQGLLLAAVAGVSLGVIGEALYQVAMHGSYARLDSDAPLRAMAIRLVLTAAAGSVLAVLRPSAAWLVFFAGFAASIADVIGAIYLHRRVLSWSPLPGTWSPISSILLSLSCVVPASIIAWVLTERWSNPPIATLVVAGAGFVSSVGAMTLLARANETITERGGVRWR